MKYQLLCLGLFYRTILGKEWLKMYAALGGFSNVTGGVGAERAAFLRWADLASN